MHTSRVVLGPERANTDSRRGGNKCSLYTFIQQNTVIAYSLFVTQIDTWLQALPNQSHLNMNTCRRG